MLWYRPNKHQRRRNRRKRLQKLERKVAQMPENATNWHHVPPRHPDRQPHFLLRKSIAVHQAYHTLFAAAKSFEDCVLILKHDWWSKEEPCLSK